MDVIYWCLHAEWLGPTSTTAQQAVVKLLCHVCPSTPYLHSMLNLKLLLSNHQPWTAPMSGPCRSQNWPCCDVHEQVGAIRSTRHCMSKQENWQVLCCLSKGDHVGTAHDNIFFLLFVMSKPQKCVMSFCGCFPHYKVCLERHLRKWPEWTTWGLMFSMKMEIQNGLAVFQKNLFEIYVMGLKTVPD